MYMYVYVWFSSLFLAGKCLSGRKFARHANEAPSVVWCSLVWCGMVWYGMVWWEVR